MSHLSRTLVLAGAIVSLCAGESLLQAQNTPPAGGAPKGDAPQKGNRQRGGGNFDPAAMRQRMMDRMKETFEVTNDDEWKIISERIEKVSEARREAGGFGGGFGGRGGPGGGAPGGTTAGGAPGATPSANPDAEALQKAIEAKASKEELKEKMAKLRESRKVGETKLEKAQEELRAVLNVRQEAQAMLIGLLR